MLFNGGVGETRTLAPGFSRPTPLAGAPRHQLEYYSKWLRLYLNIKMAERKGFEPLCLLGKRFSRPPRYDRFDTSPCDQIILTQKHLLVNHKNHIFYIFILP